MLFYLLATAFCICPAWPRRPYLLYSMAIKISIIIPSFNAACWIPDALQSVVLQDRIGECEVIVVDDSRSTDDIAGLIRRDFRFARLVTVHEPGPGAARNLGTRLASGEFIQYLDADDRLAAGKIWWQRDLLEKLGGDIAYGDWQYLEPRDGAYVAGTVIAKKLKDPELDLLTGFWCPTGAYLFRRSIVDQVGGWHGSLHYEDDRFMHDCAFRGARFVYSPGVMAYYRVGPRPLWRRDPVVAARDHHRYIHYVEDFWAAHGGIGDPRREALTRCLAALGRRSADLDRVTFEAILDDLERLCPTYIPDGPPRLRAAARLLGYRRAEMLARHYRNVKRLFQYLSRRPPGLTGLALPILT